MGGKCVPRCDVWISLQHAEDIPRSADPVYPHWNSPGTRTFCSSSCTHCSIIYGTHTPYKRGDRLSVTALNLESITALNSECSISFFFSIATVPGCLPVDHTFEHVARACTRPDPTRTIKIPYGVQPGGV